MGNLAGAPLGGNLRLLGTAGDSPENFINGVKLDNSGAFGPAMDALIKSKDWKIMLSLLEANRSIAFHKHPVSDQSLLTRALCRQLHKDVIQSLLDINPVACRDADKNGWLPIHHAACNLCPDEIMTSLLQAYPESVTVADAQGQTCLHFASKYKLPADSFRLLIQANPRAAFARTKQGALPLHFATQNRQCADVVRMLVEAHPVGLSESLDGRQPIHLACECRADVAVLQILLCRQGSAKERAASMMLPLHVCAANKAEIDAVMLITQLFPEAVAEKDRSARLPLHYALERQAPTNVIRFLLKQDISTTSVRGYGGNLPLHIALERQLQDDIVFEILDGNSAAAEIKDMFGVMPLMRAINNFSSANLILKLLSCNTRAAEEMDDFQRLPLHYAISKKLGVEVITALLAAHPIAATAVDRNKQLPLHIAIKRQAPMSVIQLLCESYPNGLSWKDEYGLTPLHHAVEVENSLPFIELLLGLNPECARTRFFNQVPLHLAIELKRFDLILVLLNAFPDAASDWNSENGRLPLQAAIHARAPFPLIMKIFNADRQICATHADEHGMLAVHYAVKYHEPVELVAQLIELDPEVVYLHDLPIYIQSVDQPAFKRRQLVSAKSSRSETVSFRGTVTTQSPSAPSILQASASLSSLDTSSRPLSKKSSRMTLKLDFRVGGPNAVSDVRETLVPDGDTGDDERFINDDNEDSSLTARTDNHYPHPDGAESSSGVRKLKLIRSKTLLHYATEVCHSNDAVVAEILRHTMPIPCTRIRDATAKGSINPRHNYCWSYILSETQDKYSEAVEMILDGYNHISDDPSLNATSNGSNHASNYTELVHRLGDLPDEIGRKAIGIATPKCQHALLRRLYFYVRYEFLHPISANIHVSSQSVVLFAYDHYDSKRVVALKFMKNRVHFQREISMRTTTSTTSSSKNSSITTSSDDYIIKLLRYHDSDTDPLLKQELIQKKGLYSDYPYILVMVAAERTFVDVMLHENFSGGRDWHKIRQIAQQLCEAIAYFHDQGVIHGDIRRKSYFVIILVHVS
jgi:ankyrin repeat protein